MSVDKVKEGYKPGTSKKLNLFLSVLFTFISIIYVMPIVVVLINSFKQGSAITTSPFTPPRIGRSYSRTTTSCPSPSALQLPV